jgi:alkyldihydroxyacetonephosphate synthase
MGLSRTAIVQGLQEILGARNVITDEQELKQSSIDRLRLYEDVHGVFTQPLPAAVAMARSTAHVADVLKFANEHCINVVPRTGRTATEGGLETSVANSIVLDGSGMDRILNVDTYNMQATVQCGVCLQTLEDEVRKAGVTTGHSPQSKPIAQMGGLVATRSIGQFSTLYGGIEDMVVGLEAVFPDGTVTRIKNIPRRAVGPDIRHVVIGNEGALCYITEITVKLFPYLPQNNTFVGYTLKHMRSGFEALRKVMVEGYRPSVARLYDPPDGAFHFSKFAAKDDCVLLFMAEGPAGVVAATIAGIEASWRSSRSAGKSTASTLPSGSPTSIGVPTRSRTSARRSWPRRRWAGPPRSRPTGVRSAISMRTPCAGSRRKCRISRWPAGTPRTATSTAPTCTSSITTT